MDLSKFLSKSGKLKPFLSSLEKEELISLSSFLPSDASLTERIYILKSKLNSRPICQLCTDECKFTKSGSGYTKFCSSSCASKYKCLSYNPFSDPEIRSNIRDKNMMKYGTSVPSKNDLVKQKIKETNLQRYGVTASFQNQEIKRKIKENCMTKYGVDHSSRSDVVKKTLKETNIKKYGVDCVFKSNEVKNKIKTTNLKKYGVENAAQSPEIQSKMQNTCADRYGYKCAAQSPQIQDKIKKTNIERYGFKNPSSSDMVKQRVENTNIEKYGVKNVFQCSEIQHKIKRMRQNLGLWSSLSFSNQTISQYALSFDKNVTQALKIYRLFGEQALIDYVENNNVKKTILEKLTEQILNIPFYNKTPSGHFHGKSHRPDFKLNETTFLDIDGLYWHSEKQQENDYHVEKRKWYEGQGFRLYQFREDELRYKSHIIKSMLVQPQNVLRASKCDLKSVKWNEAKLFLSENHLQSSGSFCRSVGLYHKNELVCLLGYRKNFKSKWEISRFCTKIEYKVHGGFSRLLKSVINDNQINEIYSWCDLRYSQGKLYETNSFTMVKETLGWSWTDGQFTYNRLTYHKDADGYAAGLYKIYDAGQRLYKLSLDICPNNANIFIVSVHNPLLGD